MNSRQSSIGIVGAGLLGSALADRLMDHGYFITVFDVHHASAQNLVSRGAESCETAIELFSNARIVFLCLPTAETVATLVNQIATGLNTKHTLFDATTGDPASIMANARIVNECGATYIEAKVAGSSEQLRHGEAILLLAGPDECITEHDSLLSVIADSRFFLGPVGNASRMKLVHNLVLGLNRAVLAEGLRFADAIGVSMDDALKLLCQSPAYSRVMETKGPKMVSGDFQPPQAKLSQHLKDVRLILAEARRVGAATPLSEVHRTLLERAEHQGLGDADNSAIIEAFQNRANEG